MSWAQDVIRCSVCENASVSISCRSCRLDFCKDCIGYHVSESSLEHDVVPYESKFTNHIIVPNCETHQNTQCTLLCKDCDVPICSTCFMERHREHSIKDFEEAVKQKQSEIKNDLAKIADFVSTFQGISSDTEEKIEKRKINCDDLASKIKFDTLQSQLRVEDNFKCIEESIIQYETNYRELLKSFESSMQNRIKLLLHKRMEKEHLLQKGVGTQVLEYKSDSYLTDMPPSLDCGEFEIQFKSLKKEEASLSRDITGGIEKSNTVGGNVVLQAEKAFQGYGEGYLCFNKNDSFLVDRKKFYNKEDDRVIGISLNDGQFGYIPKSHVAVRQLQSSCNQLQSWWMPVGRKEIEKIFTKAQIQDGSFCISEYTDDSYTLSIWCNSSVIHVNISKLKGCVSIENSDCFPNLEVLIQFLHGNSEHSLCQLSKPFCQQLPTIKFFGLQIDREQLHNLSEIPTIRLPYFDMFEGKNHANKSISIRIYKLPEFKTSENKFTICANDVIQDGEIMRACSHENILQFVGLSIASFPIVMMTEFVKETLLHYLMTEIHWEHLSLQRIVNFATQISNGMDYCHRKEFIHGNLRAENVFIDQNLVLKIAGFHFGKRIDMDPFKTSRTERISAQWASPETLLLEICNKQSDIWSFGVLLYEMITFGKLPFPGKNEDDIRKIHRIQINFPYPRDCVLKCPDSYYDVMESCCSYDPQTRPTFQKLADLFQNYFISQKPNRRSSSKIYRYVLPEFQEYWRPIGEEEAVALLMEECINPGTFLISKDTGTSYTLSVKTEDIQKASLVKHFTIFQLDGQRVCINKEKTYLSLDDLIEYHKKIKGELRCLLDTPYRDSTTPNIAYTGQELTTEFVESMTLQHAGVFTSMFNGISRNGEKICIFKYNKHATITSWTENTFIEGTNLLQKLNHDHILQVVGCCSKTKPIFMVTEPIKWILLNILRLDKGRSLEFQRLVEFASQIANGMNYLTSKGYIHRDLRAWNILLTQSFEVKIGGFYSSRRVETSQKAQDQICVRWCAPEVFQGTFLVESDVWSFGVLLYELITYGMNPYPSFTNKEVVEKILKGYTMPKPVNGPLECPEDFYEIMTSCWKTIPKERPEFKTLKNLFENYFM